MGRCWGSWTTPCTWLNMVAWAAAGPRNRDNRQSRASLRMELPRQRADDAGTSVGKSGGATMFAGRAKGAGRGVLEKLCGRAALLAGAVESHAGAGLGLWLDGGVAYDPCKDQGCSVNREVAVPDLSDYRWEGWAGLRDCRDGRAWNGGSCWPHHSHAAMRAGSSAAGRKIRVGAGHYGQHRRDQREAEEKKQNDGEDASHKVIVASFVRQLVRDMCFFPMGVVWIRLRPRLMRVLKKKSDAISKEKTRG
jgi:hypothetical protein